MERHQKYMRQALALAKQGTGFVSPNPLVGAVIVKNDKIIGEGYHARFGGIHAEAAAIRDAEAQGNDVTNAMLYVTLEPCTHFGKTAPCSDLIIGKKIAAVVIAMPDPNPVAAGGAEQLLNAGIQVTTGIMQAEAEQLNRFYLHGIRTSRPFFTVKAAISANGMVAAAAGKCLRISGKDAEIFTHGLRQEYDAILVGVETVLIDDPLLSVRHGKHRRDPLRVIIDPHLRLSKDAKVLRDEHFLLITSTASDATKSVFLNKNIVQITEGNGVLSPQLFAQELWQRNVRSVLIEGGPMTIAHFLTAELVDELIIIQSNKILPETGVPLFPNGFPEGFEVKETIRLAEDTATVYAKQ